MAVTGKSMSLRMDEGTTRKTYARSLLALADTLTMGISGLSYGPITSAARMAIVSMMSHSIRWGRMRILTAEHGIYTFPSYEAKPFEAGEEVAEIRVIRDSFWLRLVTLGDLGFAEAYMAGDCEVSDLVQIFKVSHRPRRVLIRSLSAPGRHCRKTPTSLACPPSLPGSSAW